MLVRLDHITGLIENTNHGIMCAAEMLRVADCIRDSIDIDIPEPTKRQHIGNQINAAFVFARADSLTALTLISEVKRVA